MNQTVARLLAQLNEVILGKPKQIELALTCLLAKGHLLIEDLPGMGKTTLSHALAKTLGLTYSRIQFTSDLLPADVTGVSIFNQQQHQFQFHPGPIFNQVILADEINRASPKTQSALLEAMEEKQVSVDGISYPLPEPFFVIATQNPFHQTGTFSLPESQLDRFLMRITLGFPTVEAEFSLLKRTQQIKVSALLTMMELAELQKMVESVTVSDVVIHYVLRLINYTRQAQNTTLPLSPRAGLGVLAAAKARAFIQGRDYVIHEDIQYLFAAVVIHRLFPEHKDDMAQEAITNILNKVAVV